MCKEMQHLIKFARIGHAVKRQAVYGVFHRCFNSFLETFASVSINPSRPNSDPSQTSHCNIKGLSVSEVMGIKHMITRVQFY